MRVFLDTVPHIQEIASPSDPNKHSIQTVAWQSEQPAYAFVLPFSPVALPQIALAVLLPTRVYGSTEWHLRSRSHQKSFSLSGISPLHPRRFRVLAQHILCHGGIARRSTLSLSVANHTRSSHNLFIAGRRFPCPPRPDQQPGSINPDTYPCNIGHQGPQIELAL